MPRLRISVRYKVLGLVAVVVIAALLSYLLLAISLFRSDKLAYLYDLNGTLARTLSEEIEGAVTATGERLQDFAAEVTSQLARRPAKTPRARAAAERRLRALTESAATRLLARYPDVLAVEMWRRDGTRDPVREGRWTDPTRLSALNIVAADLEVARQSSPLPFATITAEGIVLVNTSLPPDTAVLTLAVLTPDRERVVAADLRPDRLLRIFGENDIYTATLVDQHGRVLVHPEPAKLIDRAPLRSLPIVQQAIDGKTRRGVMSYRTADDTEFIGAFARLDRIGAAVITAVPTSEALAAGRQLVRKSVLLAIGILFVTVLASIFFSRRLTAPIRRIEEATRMISRAEFDISVAVRTGDEVGALATAFNKMAAELLDRDRRLEDTHQQLLQSSKLAVVGEMAAGISHEVKNPMAGMRGFAQLGLQATALADAHELFGLIEKETTRATGILENLLRFTRMGMSADFVELDVAEVVAEAVRLVRHQLSTKGIRLHVASAEALPPVLGNSNQLQQVLLNLMINAQHAMEAGTGELFVTTTGDGGQIRISIRDTGVGIGPEAKTHLFRAFHTTKASGTGLGLSVSHRIVTEHGGRIEVESELGKGSEFTVVLPSSAAAHISEEAVDRRGAATPGVGDGAAAGTGVVPAATVASSALASVGTPAACEIAPAATPETADSARATGVQGRARVAR